MGSISPGVLSFCISLGGVYEIIIYFRNPGRGDKPKDSYGGSVWNYGEVQSYYMEGSHPAILSTEVWDALQDKIEENKRGRNIA